MPTKVITKKSSTASTTNNTSYISMMTPNVSSNTVTNNSMNRRRENSNGEDSGVQIDHDSISNSVHSSITKSSNIVPSLLLSTSSSTSKAIGTTTAPNPHSVTNFSGNSTMVTSSTLIPPSTETKISSILPRKTSNASSSGAFSEASRSFGHEENSADSFYGLTSSSLSSHYVIKCTLNATTTTTTNTNTSSMLTPSSISAAPATFAPRVKVTIQQPSITTPPSRMDSSTESVSSSLSSSFFLKTPKANNIPMFSSSLMTTSTASSAPEFSISGASSIDDSEELALYEQYLSISYGRQSNPSPEMRKIAVDDLTKLQQRTLPRSKSEVNTIPMEQPHDHHRQQQQQTTTSIQIKPEPTSYVSEDDDSTARVTVTPHSTTTTDMTKKKKSKAATLAKDFKSRAANLIRRRTTEATLSEKSLIPSRDDVQSWEESFEALLRHRYGQALFRAFLRTEFSEENLEFWLACDEFRACKEPKRSTKAKKIYMDFIAIGAPKQVNLDTETRMSTIANIDNPPLETFDRAQRRIQGLMEKDPYQRFLKSELYINLLRRTAYPVQRRTTAEVASKSS
ncbi:unnamed protein product [Rotaria magnacalcarata]|uniref:RGS domain-containing protein n=1 Tax=Rotaria magnacalcarata TaxID=392030 RepID=A0A815F0R8_9BILA|nr:unnamed protein product [Rotaria magnacalcarata]